MKNISHFVDICQKNVYHIGEVRQNMTISRRPKISRRRIYSTIMATPPLLVSNMAFARGYRFRRETLMLSMESSVTEENL